MELIQQHPGYATPNHNLKFELTKLASTNHAQDTFLSRFMAKLATVNKASLLLYPATFILFSGFLIFLAVAAAATALVGMSYMITLFIPVT